jgi:hypothetical protein
MPPAANTFPALELRQDGDVLAVKIKQSGTKPVLKDLQSFLKKKTAISLLTTYSYGERKLSMFGYTKGKEDEANQHELPPPFESPGVFGSILLVAHASAVAWDGGGILSFSVPDYEAFYEKACNGEIEEKPEEDEEETFSEAAEEEAEEEDEEKDAEDLLEGGEEDEEGGEIVDDVVEDEEEEVVRPTRSRRVAKIDPQQLQFQYANDLRHQDEISEEVITGHRAKVLSGLEAILKEMCSRKDLLTLEMGIFNAAIAEAAVRKIPQSWQTEQFQWVYKMIAKRVASNFQEHIVSRWKDGEFSLESLGAWSHFDLNPANWKELKDQQFRREKRILEGNAAMATDRFRCSRCQKKMCTYYELQTRSADEPMTIFITCVNCGKQWRQ